MKENKQKMKTRKTVFFHAIRKFIGFLFTLVLGAFLWTVFGQLSNLGILPESCLAVYNNINNALNTAILWVMQLLNIGG